MRSKYYQQKFKAAAKRRVKRRAAAPTRRRSPRRVLSRILRGGEHPLPRGVAIHDPRALVLEDRARGLGEEEARRGEIRAARLEEARAEEERRRERKEKGASSKKGNAAASGGKGRGGGRSSSGPGGDDRAGDKPNPAAPARVRTEDPEARIRADRRRAAREARLARRVSGVPEVWAAFDRRTLDSEQQQQQSRECDLTRPFSAVSVLRACVAAGIVDIDGEAGIVDSEKSTRDAYERAMASLVERFGGGGGSGAEAADEAALARWTRASTRRRRSDARRGGIRRRRGCREGGCRVFVRRIRPPRRSATSVVEYSASGAEAAAAADSVYDAAEDPEVVAAEAAKAAKKEKAKAAKAAIAAKAKAANRAAKDASRGGKK